MSTLFQTPNPASIRLNDQADALFAKYGIIFDTNEGAWRQDQSAHDATSELWTAAYSGTGEMANLFRFHRNSFMR